MMLSKTSGKAMLNHTCIDDKGMGFLRYIAIQKFEKEYEL